MYIKFWGTRGSIPAPGPQTVRYGGNTTCVEVRSDNGDLIVIDAGTGIRMLGNQLLKSKNIPHIHLFLTHSHWDHIQGFPFFAPAYIKGVRITVYGCPPAYTKLQEILSDQMESRYFPVNFEDLNATIDFKTFCEDKKIKVGKFDIETIENYHPGTAYALKFIEKKKIFVFMTDNELSIDRESPTTWEEFVDFIKRADVFVHDAQWKDDELPHRKKWGHSSYQQVLKLGMEAGVKSIYFFHHAPERADFEIDEFVFDSRDILKKHNKNIFCDAAREGKEIVL